LSRDGNFLYASPSIERALGYKPEELRGQNFFARLHPDDLLPVQEAFQFALDHPERTVKKQFRHQTKR